MSAPILLGVRVLAALALYAFLGTVLYLAWQTLRAQAILLTANKVPPLKINITRPENGTESVTLQKSEILIGRELGCDLHAEDASASARHARISYHHGQWWAEDLGSTNGSLLNEAPLITAAILIHGDILQCGHTLFEINIPESDKKQ